MHHFSTKDTNTRLYVLRKHALFKKAVKGAQSMLDAGCAALLEDEDRLFSTVNPDMSVNQMTFS